MSEKWMYALGGLLIGYLTANYIAGSFVGKIVTPLQKSA